MSLWPNLPMASMRKEYIFPEVITWERSQIEQYIIDYNHHNEICLAKFGYHYQRELELDLSTAFCEATNKDSGSDTGKKHTLITATTTKFSPQCEVLVVC